MSNLLYFYIWLLIVVRAFLEQLTFILLTARVNDLVQVIYIKSYLCVMSVECDLLGSMVVIDFWDQILKYFHLIYVVVIL